MMISPRGFTLRLTTESDIPALEKLIAHSVRSLQAADYSSEQIEGALGTVFGAHRLIDGAAKIRAFLRASRLSTPRGCQPSLGNV